MSTDWLRLTTRPRSRPRTRLLLEAAVAVVLRGASREAAEVLLIRRSRRHGDPWSGDMAFPGGRRAPGDPDLVTTAVRETREEIGLRLEPALALGGLPPVYTVAPTWRSGLAPRYLPMRVQPVVFALAGPDECTPNAEVEAIRWTPLAHLAAPARRTTRPWRMLGITWPAPAWDLDGDVVWGLTYAMLRSLLSALEP